MIFHSTSLPGAFILEIEPQNDERGFFARTFCTRELATHGLDTRIDQCSISFNNKAGTLRGMHFQAQPHEEAKLVRCTAGVIFDVIIDLRASSGTRGCWFGVELSEKNHKALFVPKGFAHGFLTLADRTEVFYQISVPFVPNSGRGIRWNDPAIGIVWPMQPSIISERDASYPSLAGFG